MATLPSSFCNEENIRCQDVRWALDVFNIGIKDYFEDIFRLFHSNLEQNVVQIHGYCSQKCSRKLPVEKWCSLCNEWRVEILAKHRFRNTIKDISYWKNIDSSKWQSDVKEVQKIFLPNRYKGKLDANDLSSILNIMTNCTLFDNHQELNDIRDIRNKVFHNKTSLTVKEKTDYVGTISSYLDNDFLKRYQSVVKATEHVKLLEKCTIKDIHEKNLIGEQERLKLEERLHSLKKPSCDRKFIFLQFLVVILAVAMYSLSVTKRSIVSEESPWIPGKPSTFVAKHDDFVGRKWLKKKIIESFGQRRSGVILVAEPGFGKSALVSNFIQTYGGENLPLLGYHICQYDSWFSLEVSNFIINLWRDLQNRNVEFAYAIPSNLKGNSGLKEFCSLDPMQCFRELIVHPLKSANISERYLFILDAIDECQQIEKISLSDILLKHYKVLEPILFIFMTSRNDSAMLARFRTFKQIHVDPNSRENSEDLKQLIHHKAQCTDSEANEIITKANNNFLILRYYLFIIDDKCTFTQTQEKMTIFEIYEFEFSRLYGNGFSRKYRCDRSFFEVFSSQQFEDLLTVNTMNAILTYSSSVPDDDEFDDMIQRIKTNLVRISDIHEIRPLHSSLFEWLLSEENVKFKINIERGHYLWANYLFDKISMRKMDIIEHTDYRSIFQPYSLARHFINARNESLQDDLSSGKFKISDIKISCVLCWKLLPNISPFFNRTFSHIELARFFFDDYQIMKTLILLSRKTDWTNETASALMTNHNNSFTAFLNTGKIDFKYKHMAQISQMHFENDIKLDIIEYMKKAIVNGEIPANFESVRNEFGKFSEDYINIFHIAIQNSPWETIEMILLQDRSLLYEKTGNGWDVFDILILLDRVDIFNKLQDSMPRDNSAWYLWLASVHGSKSIIHILLNGRIRECEYCRGNEYDEKYEIYRTFLRNASYAKSLILMPQSFRLRRELICESALLVAVKQGYYEVVQILLQHGSYCLEYKDAFGFTPLAAALYFRHDLIVRLLILYRANVDFVVKSSLKSFQVEFFNAILRFPHEQKWKTKNTFDGATIFHLISLKPTCQSTTLFRRILLKNAKLKLQSDLDLKDGNGKSPLYYSVCHPESDNKYENSKDFIHPKAHRMAFVLIEASSTSTITDSLLLKLGICGSKKGGYSRLTIISGYTERFCDLKSNFPSLKYFTVKSGPTTLNAFQNLEHSIIAEGEEIQTGHTHFVLNRINLPKEFTKLYKDNIDMNLKSLKFEKASQSVSIIERKEKGLKRGHHRVPESSLKGIK